MSPSQGEDKGEMRSVGFQQEPPQGYARMPEEVASRNAHGQSLDEARETFRAGWEVKLQETRQQAARARRLEDRLSDAPRRILIGGALCGAAIMAVTGAMLGGLPDLVMGALIGGVNRLLVLLPPALVALLCQGCWKRRAERLERQVREMERS